LAGVERRTATEAITQTRADQNGRTLPDSTYGR